MAKIANVALTNTFNTWRTNSNQAFDRLSQFAINNSSLYANTLTANTAFTSKGTTNLGDGTGDLTTITGRTTIGTNLTVSGNTTSNKITVTSSLTSSGNTAISGLLANGALGTSDFALKTNGTSVFWGIALSNTFTTTVTTKSLIPAANITHNLGSTTKRYKDIFLANSTIHLGSAQISASGNKVLFNNVAAVSNSFLTATFATKSNPTTSGLLAHTGRATVSTNLAVSGNTTISGLIANGALGSANFLLKSNGTGVFWAASAAGGTTIPSGTVMLFAQTTAPTGFTKDTGSGNNHALRVVTGAASTGGTVDFTTAFASQAVSGSVSVSAVSGSAGAMTLTTPQIPSHSHTAGPQAIPDNPEGTTFRFQSRSGTLSTDSTGGGGSHDHPFSFSSATASFSGTAINLAVKYVDVIRATKD